MTTVVDHWEILVLNLHPVASEDGEWSKACCRRGDPFSPFELRSRASIKLLSRDPAFLWPLYASLTLFSIYRSAGVVPFRRT